MNRLALCGLLAVSMVVSTRFATAAVVDEFESDGAATNNSLTSAQAIATSAFTLPVSESVFNPPGYLTAAVHGSGGFSDVDFFQFYSYGGRVYLDMDNADPTFDAMLALFDRDGTLLAYADDSDLDEGSVNSIDPFLGVFVLPGAGDYYVAVSDNPNYPTVALSGAITSLSRPDGLAGGWAVTGVANGTPTFDFSDVQPGNGAYTLHISAEGAVPEPASYALLGCGLLAIGIAARRRRTF